MINRRCAARLRLRRRSGIGGVDIEFGGADRAQRKRRLAG
jgi:hypothetical protein